MKLFLLSLLVLGLNLSCTKKPALPDPICKSLFRAVTGTANVLATTLECKNPGVIAGDLSEQFLKLGLCSESQMQSTLSDFLCPQIAVLVTSTVSNTIPASWECTATTINDIIKGQITENCAKILK